MKDIDEKAFLEALKNGVARTTNLIAKATDYHGGPVMTEYLLTADIAREFIERDYPVAVECHNRMFVNAMTGLKAAQPRKLLRSKRTDVAIVEAGLIPLALIEVKIRVKKLRAVKGDLDKITTTMSLLKANVADKVIGAVVFQVHIPGTMNRIYAADFKSAAEKIEMRLHDELSCYVSWCSWRARTPTGVVSLRRLSRVAAMRVLPAPVAISTSSLRRPAAISRHTTSMHAV
jgi:hypothetical protein